MKNENFVNLFSRIFAINMCKFFYFSLIKIFRFFPLIKFFYFCFFPKKKEKNLVRRRFFVFFFLLHISRNPNLFENYHFSYFFQKSIFRLSCLILRSTQFKTNSKIKIQLKIENEHKHKFQYQR